jgi:hypothetical protein
LSFGTNASRAKLAIVVISGVPGNEEHVPRHDTPAKRHIWLGSRQTDGMFSRTAGVLGDKQ